MAIRFDVPAPWGVRTAVAAVLGTALMLPALAYTAESSQKKNDTAELEEVQVTGSRIMRRDLESTTPMVVVGEETFDNTANVGVEASLNKLPQFVPGLDQFDTADLQFNSNSTVGATNVNLRGLGANRNLVLINGRRAVPVNATLVADTGSIPSSAISRVEVITGGASSVYGADAVGGVVNFILKDNYQGADFDVQYGVSEKGDNKNLRLSGLIGGNFGDGRGNAILGMDYTNRGSAYQRDRDFYVEQLLDPYVGGTQFSSTYTQYAANTNINGSTNLPNQTVVNNLFGQTVSCNAFVAATALNSGVCNNATFSIQPDGTLFVQGDPDTMSRYNGGFDLSKKLLKSATDQRGTLVENSLVSRISSPLKRYSMFGSAHFDLTDDATLYTQATFSQLHAESIFDYVAAFGTWGVTIPHGTGRACTSLNIGQTSQYRGTLSCQDTDFFPGAAALGLTGAAAAGVTSWATVPTLSVYQNGGDPVTRLNAGLACAARGGCTNNQAFPVPAQLATLLDSRPNPNADFALNQNMKIFNDPRRTEQETTNFQLVAGIKGNLPIKDWTYDVNGTFGTSRTLQNLYGVAALQRYRMLVRMPLYGRAATVVGNAGPPGGGNNAPTGTCTSGLPIFTQFAISQNCVDMVKVSPSNITKMDQVTAEASIQGGLFELPAGEVRFALGSAFRENVFSYVPDALLDQGAVSDSVIGLDPISGFAARDHVFEGFAEMLVPVLVDQPFAKHLNLELGYRYSDYLYAAKVGTWKALLDWAITPDLRLRGGVQRANRAPNMGELFQKTSDSLSVSQGDPCTTTFGLGYGANPTTNAGGAAGAAKVRALCEQMMGGTGSQGALNYYVSPGTLATGVFTGFAFEFQKAKGNANLTSEKADTFTLGAVLRSPFEHPLLQFTTTADYYRIKIKDAISQVSLFTLYEVCFSEKYNTELAAGNTAGALANPFCQQLPRNQTTGGKDRATVTYDNVGVFDTSGVDFSFNWSAALADMGLTSVPGRFSYGVTANYTLHNKREDLPGFNARDNTGFAPFDFRWQLFQNFGWSNGPFNLSVRWRHYPSLANFARQSNPNSGTEGPPAYDILDLSGGYSFSRKLSLRFGVDNLLDKAPPINGYNPGAGGPGTTGYSRGSILSGAAYDVIGRQYFAGLKMSF
jgi:iron complex outermembrane recepter protein